LKSSRIRRAGVLAAAGAIAFFVPALTTSATANAETRFCQTSKGSPCLGPINGCTFILGGGKYIFVDDGDTIVNGAGERYKCSGGKWVKEARAFEVSLGDILGRGVLEQKAPYDGGCNPEQVFCP